MNNPDKMIIIGSVNPFDSKVGGGRYYVMNILNSIGSDVNIMLCGYTTAKNADRHLKNNQEFLPLVIYNKKKDRYIFPQSFKFIIKLYNNRKKILEKGKVLHIQRLDFTIPFLYPSKKGKIVVYFHGAASKGYLTGKGLKSKLKGHIYGILERLILPKVDKIVTVSKKDADFYASKYPKIKNKIAIIPVPVNLDEFRIKSDKKALQHKFGLNDKHKIILYLGRFSRVKGIDFIMRTFVDLNKDKPETDLILVGKGEEENRLKRLASDLNVKNISFLGALAHEDVPNIMNCADVLAMASYTEGLPSVTLEALACGLPVVSTDVGDIDKLLINENIGFLVKQRNEKDYKNKLIKALEISNKFKEERQDVAKRYSAPKITQKIINLHNEVGKV
jgi:glycosyltransferase involved in cell wall biosynthesis